MGSLLCKCYHAAARKHRNKVHQNVVVGLAAVLILASFLYQRFMTGKDEEEEQER